MVECLVDTADPASVLREVKRVIERNGMASLSELERALGVSVTGSAVHGCA